MKNFFLQQMGGFARSVSSRIWEKKNVTKHIYSRKFFLTRCDEAMMKRQSPSHPGLRRTAEEPLCNKYLIQCGCRNITVLFFRFPPIFILLFFHKFKRTLPADSCWCQRSTSSFSILLCPSRNSMNYIWVFALMMEFIQNLTSCHANAFAVIRQLVG